MLYINNVQYYIPTTKMHITHMQSHTNLSPGMIKIFHKIYGLEEILMSCDMSMIELLSEPVEKVLTNTNVPVNNIKYLIHAHTAPILSPFGLSLPRALKEKFNLKKAIAFGTSMYKCVSAIKSLEILSTLLMNSADDSCSLIVTGEISFTPELKLIPRTSIGGDAATAALVSNYGNDHRLLAIEIKLLEGYAKGIYLTDQELKTFESQFINFMCKTIYSAIDKAGITLNQIALILPHNVNYLIWKAITQGLKISKERVYTDNISKFGHCFSSDPFLNLALAQETNRLIKGDYYLMAACGMGFFFACAVFKF